MLFVSKTESMFQLFNTFFFFSSNFEDYRDPLKIYDKGNATRSLKKVDIEKKKKRTKKKLKNVKTMV